MTSGTRQAQRPMWSTRLPKDGEIVPQRPPLDDGLSVVRGASGANLISPGVGGCAQRAVLGIVANKPICCALVPSANTDATRTTAYG